MNKTSFCVVSLIIYAGTRAVARAKIDVVAACKYLVLIYIGTSVRLCASGTIFNVAVSKNKIKACSEYILYSKKKNEFDEFDESNRTKYILLLVEINTVQIVKCTLT